MSECEQGPEQRHPGLGPDSVMGLGVGAKAWWGPQIPSLPLSEQ